ncbi:MAG: xanthine dehydrogenase family protein molybdopterin-binding subunit, partial [Chloroflexi bacterium]|nr:xanthine dehydrogenase family protein molybdopterin-binding subunit [Chloroflexota bacterium]
MTYAGQSVRRFEDHRLLTGQSSYVDDMKLPGLLHAVVLRSLHAHATIRSIDVSAATRLPGVVAVFTAADIEDLAVQIPTRTNSGADEFNPPRHPVLASDKVCYVGQAMAVVIAEDPYTAADALEQIVVDYEVLPAVIDPHQAMEEGATVVHPDMGSNVCLRTLSGGGDLDAAFAQADHVVRQTYQVQRLAPAPMEPRGLIAEYQPDEDLLTVWDSTQHPHEVREHLVHLLGRTESGVRVVAPDVGGGFGEKASLFPEEVVIPYLAILLGRPIKWVENRQENMTAFHGRGHSVEVEAAVRSDSIILGIKVRIVADLGAYCFLSTPTVPVLTTHRLTGPYRTPAMTVEVQGVVTNKPPTGAYRGAGGPEAAFCMERTIDLIARDLGLDPADVRRRNFISPDAFPYDTPTGITYDSGEYEAAFDRALELSDYDGWRERSRQQSKDGDSLIGV